MIEDYRPYSPVWIKTALQRMGIRPSKRLGQNFLIDRGVIARIISASGLSQGETCLEIGPGLGALTGALALTAGKVIAVEVDSRLAGYLLEIYGTNQTVEIVHKDFLKADIRALLEYEPGKTRVIANIPYSITSPIIERLLSVKDRVSGITLLVQKEVAARLGASPGSDDYSSLTVYCAYHCRVTVLFDVPRHLFYPRPEVESSLVSLEPMPPRLEPDAEALFFRILRASFSQRRKRLANCLASGMNIPKAEAEKLVHGCGLPPDVRAEELSLDAFLSLTKAAVQLPGLL